MSTKDLTKFAEQGRNLVLMAFDHDLPKSSVGRALASRTDTLLKGLRRAGYKQAFAYAEIYDGALTVTFDQTPAKGDGWAVVFALDENPKRRQFLNPRERKTVYVPDVGAAS